MTVLLVELYTAVAATVAVPFLIDHTIVLDCTGSLNVALGAAETATPVALDAGVWAVTVTPVEDKEASAPMSVSDPATRGFPFQSVGSLASATTWSITWARVALLETR